MTQEDVPGVVIEPGSRHTRFGVAGDVAPHSVVPSAVLRDGDATWFDVPVSGPAPPHGEVWTPVIDGVVHDFEVAAGMWAHLAESGLGFRLDEQPLTVTEEVWNPAASRQKLLETVFEELRVPLFQLVKAPLAATFESSRANALVVSVGAAMTSATPVVDGIVRAKAATHTRFAGDFVDAHLLQQLDHAKHEIIPQYQIKAKLRGTDKNVPVSSQKDFKLAPRGTDSYHSFQLSRLLDDFKRVCCVTSPTPLSGPEIKGTRLYEFPSGYNMLVGHERLVPVETLFNPTIASLADGSTPGLNSLGLSEVIYNTVQKVDAPPEVVLSLLSNVVLHGGTSHTAGLARRVENDLGGLLPNYSVTVHHARDHPVWTGASVLASLNEFDESTWITKQQYQELGVPYLLERLSEN